MARAGKIVSLAAVLLLAALVLPFPLAHVAEAVLPPSDVWVAPPPLGDDGNPGTKYQPFATIQMGIDTVELGGGGTVHVAAGTYHDNLNIDQAVNLIGAGAQSTIIDGDGLTRVIYISSAPDTENIISGFTIQNGYHISRLWNPTHEQILFAGINLDSIKTLPRLFNAVGLGGGIFIGDTHIVTLNDCVIRNNQAERGGGIYNEGQLTMNRCTVSGNSAIYGGGGIYNDMSGPGGEMWLTNCTISGNSLTLDGDYNGAGIYNIDTMELLNCTIAYNYTTTNPNAYGGGFAENVPAISTFKNTIVANNKAGNSSYNNGYIEADVVATSLGNNLCGDNSCGFNQPTDMVNTNPLLGPLQDNGGPTFTHALLEGSPAIDAGTCTGAPATDQRGITRPQGENCDIGAFELEYQIPVSPPGPGSSPSIQTPPRPLNPSQLSAQYVSVSPQQTYANQPVTITTNVVNTGDEAGNLNVVLKINGLVEQSRMVGVGPQGTQPVKFTVAKAQPGTYTVDILGEQGSFVVLGSGSTGGTPVNSGLIALLIMGVLVLATILVLVLTRRPA